jgi:hypothetical protein
VFKIIERTGSVKVEISISEDERGCSVAGGVPKGDSLVISRLSLVSDESCDFGDGNGVLVDTSLVLVKLLDVC